MQRPPHKCDSCGATKPQVVDPILFGFHGWRFFDIDGTKDDRRWKAVVLLCKEHTQEMERFISAGGTVDCGVVGPKIRTLKGGSLTTEEVEWLDPDPAPVAAVA